ncbi:hypothetical protein EI94DRAFT_1702997 [Lactarius quietus]|nr:hypothetical protein EI94DRAFT_1702997 [Lactarius quietus]
MSTTTPSNGRIILHSLTTIKNHRQIPGKPFSYVYDGLFSCADLANTDEDGVASFRHYVGRNPNTKQDGMYEVYAKIAGYEYARKVASPEFIDNKFNLLGDIISMQPLSDEDDKLDDTIRLNVSGTVASKDNNSCSFLMHCVHFVCDRQQQIAIRGRMDRNPKWKTPTSLLPVPNAIIGFDGILDHFEKYCPSQSSDEITCAVVSLEDITFLLSPAKDSSDSSKKDVRARIKKRRQKKPSKSSPSLPTDSPTITITSSSQKSLGKHKASSSAEDST